MTQVQSTNRTAATDVATRLDSAIRYHKRGLPVILCDGKIPLGGKQWQLKTWDEEAIRLEFQRHPNRNIGLKSGPDSGVDIEADGPEEESIFAELFEGCEIPIGPTYESSRGKHRWFKWDDRLAECNKAVVYVRGKNSKGKLGVRIGAGGLSAQSIIPPSPGRDWVAGLSFDECDLPPLPEKVIQRLIDSTRSKAAPATSNGSHNFQGNNRVVERCRKYVAKIPPAISGQGGSDQTFAVACVLFQFGLSDDDSRQVLAEYNSRCEPPWNEHELDHKLSDAKQNVAAAGEFGSRLHDDRPSPTTRPSGASGVNGKPSRFHNTTDLGNAGRFASQHNKRARFCYVWRCWVIWTGKRWEVDNCGHAERLAKQTVRSIYREAADSFDSNRREATAKWATQSEKAERIANMLKLARSEPGISVAASEFDTDPMLLNCANGIIDLKTGELRDHDPAAMLTKLAPHRFDLDADCPRWKQFISEIFAGNESLISFIKRAVGYTLTGRTSERCLLFLYGNGCNGKTTLVSTLEKLLGDYSTTITTEMLMASRNQSHQHEICDLAGRRLALANETESGRRFAESLIKQLTGGEDKLKGRRLYQDFWEFVPSHKLWISGNHKPVIVGNDAAIWDRMRLVPFGVRFENPDRGLAGKLEAEMDGILRWAVAGAIEWQAEGLGMPEEVVTATGDYRSDMDLMGNFIDDRCLVGNSYRSKASVLYSSYHSWAESNGEHPESQRKFGMRLADRGFGKIRNNGIWYIGITTNTQTEP